MSIYAPSQHEYQSLLRIATASISEPPWFAAPVEFREEDDSITLCFLIAETCDDVRVRVEGNRLTIRAYADGDRWRPKHVCPLPCDGLATEVEKAREGEMLRVRLRKKRPENAVEACPTEPNR